MTRGKYSTSYRNIPIAASILPLVVTGDSCTLGLSTGLGRLERLEVRHPLARLPPESDVTS